MIVSYVVGHERARRDGEDILASVEISTPTVCYKRPRKLYAYTLQNWGRDNSEYRQDYMQINREIGVRFLTGARDLFSTQRSDPLWS
jgi:hypothetical protein